MTNVSRPDVYLYTFTLLVHQVYLCAKHTLSIRVYLYWKGQHVVVSCKPVRQADCRLRFLLTVLEVQPAASVHNSGCRKAHFSTLHCRIAKDCHIATDCRVELAYAVAAGDEPAGH